MFMRGFFPLLLSAVFLSFSVQAEDDPLPFDVPSAAPVIQRTSVVNKPVATSNKSVVYRGKQARSKARVAGKKRSVQKSAVSGMTKKQAAKRTGKKAVSVKTKQAPVASKKKAPNKTAPLAKPKGKKAVQKKR
ncbi:hypothetical protein VN23_10825 [Janthinobacterium sp. B9-8]|nr:hypothetical protein VN23_10825 [Janthinobacterium sp. B9-8]